MSNVVLVSGDNDKRVRFPEPTVYALDFSVIICLKAIIMLPM